jgi:hypothetical protein
MPKPCKHQFTLIIKLKTLIIVETITQPTMKVAITINMNVEVVTGFLILLENLKPK